MLVDISDYCENIYSATNYFVARRTYRMGAPVEWGNLPGHVKYPAVGGYVSRHVEAEVWKDTSSLLETLVGSCVC